jgi:hypothetical protein
MTGVARSRGAYVASCFCCVMCLVGGQADRRTGGLRVRAAPMPDGDSDDAQAVVHVAPLARERTRTPALLDSATPALGPPFPTTG